MILRIIQEPPLLSRASDLAAALSCSYGMRQEQKHGDQYQLVKLLLSSHSWESLELRNKTYIYNTYFIFYDGFKKIIREDSSPEGLFGAWAGFWSSCDWGMHSSFFHGFFQLGLLDGPRLRLPHKVFPWHTALRVEHREIFLWFHQQCLKAQTCLCHLLRVFLKAVLVQKQRSRKPKSDVKAVAGLNGSWRTHWTMQCHCFEGLFAAKLILEPSPISKLILRKSCKKNLQSHVALPQEVSNSWLQSSLLASSPDGKVLFNEDRLLTPFCRREKKSPRSETTCPKSP